MSGFDISDWLDVMPDSVSVKAWTGKSVSGVPTYSATSTSYPCRIEMMNHKVVNSHGMEVLARGRIILGTAVVIGIKDLITLPSDYVPTQPPIMAVDVIPDDTGSHHTTIHIG